MNMEKLSFEEIMKQNERRIHYQIHKLNLRDPDRAYFSEGLVAMWNAYENYQPDKGPLATYFNYTIRHRLLDQVRKQQRAENNEKRCVEGEVLKLNNGNYAVKGSGNLPITHVAEEKRDYDYMLEKSMPKMSINQQKWIELYIKEGFSIAEIAEQEGVSCDAVKSWGREARKKLRRLVGEDLD